MAENNDCKPRTRLLYDWEVTEVRMVFSDQLDYARVRIHECSLWPTRLHHLRLKIGRLFSRSKKDADDHASHGQTLNAITLGNHCYFPIYLPTDLIPADQPQAGRPVNVERMKWLVHELTHCWQFQDMGVLYLARALYAQLFIKSPYKYGKAEGLSEKRTQGKTIRGINVEAQGEITSDYYRNLRRGTDVTAWEPFIEDLQKQKLKHSDGKSGD